MNHTAHAFELRYCAVCNRRTTHEVITEYDDSGDIIASRAACDEHPEDVRTT
jgi:hypothetical protein